MKSMIAAALAVATLVAMPADAAEPRISGPYQQDNLTVFLIHDRTAPGSEVPFMTLDEALPAGHAAVHETGDVNNLEVENLSKDRLLFIQAGDIVKGGKQDRVLSVDLILPPGSGRTSIAVFCVEHGRWSERGDEPAQNFASADKAIAGKDLKLAAKSEKSQQGVWNAVSKAQAMLAEAVGGDVAAEESPSSLQLTLENEKVASAIAAQIAALKDLAGANEDATGFIYAVNGKISGGDIYASRDLFRKLWPRLLESSAVEAIAARGEQTVALAATEDDVRRLLSTADGIDGRRENLPAGVTLISRENNEIAAFETGSTQIDGAVHRNYIVK